MNEKTLPVVEKMVHLVESLEGIKHTELEVRLTAEFPNLDKNTILTAMSECVQDGLVKRIEYSLPKRSWSSRAFYLPIGSMLVN